MTLENNTNQISVSNLADLEAIIIGIVKPIAGIVNDRDGLAPKVSDEAAKMIRESIIRALEAQKMIVELEGRIDKMQAIASPSRQEEIEKSIEYWQAQQSLQNQQDNMVR